MQIIEEAFQQGKSHVLLDKYRIDLKEFIQFKRSNSSKQRPVRRQEGTDQQECIREDRFFRLLLFNRRHRIETSRHGVHFSMNGLNYQLDGKLYSTFARLLIYV